MDSTIKLGALKKWDLLLPPVPWQSCF